MEKALELAEQTRKADLERLELTRKADLERIEQMRKTDHAELVVLLSKKWDRS